MSVARKTDAAMWPALFLAVGVPSELLNNLVDAGALASAACCLLIVDRIEGSATAHSSALRLIKASKLLAAHVGCSVECGDSAYAVSKLPVSMVCTIVKSLKPLLVAMQLALAESQYDLAAELLRFVVPPTDNDDLFASINGAHGAGHQAGTAKDASPAPPRVRRELLPLSMLHATSMYQTHASISSCSGSSIKPGRLRAGGMPDCSSHVNRATAAM